MAATPPPPASAGDIDALHYLQQQLVQQVELRDRFAQPLRSIAGFVTASEDDGATLRATALLLDADTLAIIDRQVARLPAAMPEITDLQGFRVLPALLEALAMLKHPPDLAFVDGHGTAHPRRLGIAARLRRGHRPAQHWRCHLHPHRRAADGAA